MSKLRILTSLLYTIAFPLFSNAQIEWSSLTHTAAELVKENNSGGLSIIIVNKDRIVYSNGFGYADRERQELVTDSTLFVVGSITKTFTAIGILKLVEQGLIRFDDEVKRIAPKLPISTVWEKEHPLKVYHLLEHTSGFDELHLKDRSLPIENDEFPLLDGLSIVKNSLKTRWKPGTRFAYSNVNYLVAGYLIEKVSGISYNDFMISEVLKPIDMHKSSIRLNDVDSAMLAKSYVGDQSLPFKHIFTRPTGSLISSSTDMGNFLMMLLNQGGSFLKPKLFQEFEKHRSIDAFEGTANGYLRGIYPRFKKGRKWLGHGGSINKYNSEFEYCPEIGLGIFVTSNGPNATRVVDEMLSAFHELIPEATTKDKKTENTFTSSLEKYKGYYVLTSPRNQLLYPFTEFFSSILSIDYQDNQLILSDLQGSRNPLIQTGESQFSLSGTTNEYQYVFDDSILYTSLGFSYKRTSVLPLAILGGALILSLFVICWSQISLSLRIINLFRKKNGKLNALLPLELASTFFLLAILLFLTAGSTLNIHTPQPLTIGLFLCSLLFPLLTVAGIFLLLWRRTSFSTFKKTWVVLLACSTSIWSSYLAYWDFIGFTIWNY